MISWGFIYKVISNRFRTLLITLLYWFSKAYFNHVCVVSWKAYLKIIVYWKTYGFSLNAESHWDKFKPIRVVFALKQSTSVSIISGAFNERYNRKFRPWTMVGTSRFQLCLVSFLWTKLPRERIYKDNSNQQK